MADTIADAHIHCGHAYMRNATGSKAHKRSTITAHAKKFCKFMEFGWWSLAGSNR